METMNADAIFPTPAFQAPEPRGHRASAPSGPEKLLTAEEVAERLGVGVKWVWAQARAGSIPHVKLGRYRRFRPEAIDRWIADLERRSSA
jgi:excisionase family DNA binding protein